MPHWDVLQDVSAQSAGRESLVCTAVPDPRELAQGALLVSDLDGTLLRPDGTLGLDTVEVINAFIGDGGLFTYATARSFTSASRATDALNLQLPVITYGGAIVVDPTGGETRQAQMLQPAVVSRVLELTAESGIQPILFVMHEGHDRVCWLPDRTTPWIQDFLLRRPGDPRLMPPTDWSMLDLSAVFYVSLIASREPLADLQAALGDVLSDCHVVLVEDIYAPGDWWLELTSVSGTKAAAPARRQARRRPAQPQDHAGRHAARHRGVLDHRARVDRGAQRASATPCRPPVADRQLSPYTLLLNGIVVARRHAS